MMALVGEMNCRSIDALQDALDLRLGQFEVVTAAAQVCGDLIIVLKAGWDVCQQAVRTGFSFQADQPAQRHSCQHQPAATPEPLAEQQNVPAIAARLLNRQPVVAVQRRRFQRGSLLPMWPPHHLAQAERGQAGLGPHDVVAARIAKAEAAAGAIADARAAELLPQHLRGLEAIADEVLAGAQAFQMSGEAGSEDEEEHALLSFVHV